MGSLSATNLATYQHLACDLYMRKAYYTSKSMSYGVDNQPEITKAEFRKGIQWEKRLYSYLDAQGLLLKIPPIPITGETLLENILAEERPHFFISGVTFHPPKEDFDVMFRRYGSRPLDFGLAKPDLLEVRLIDGTMKWRVVDAKASKHVKTSHHIQIYFYTLCLNSILHQPTFLSSELPAVWLPPRDHFLMSPSFDDIHTIPMALLDPSFQPLIFRDVSKIVHSPSEELDWHFNARCRDCRYQNECKSNVREYGHLGNIPNIQTEDARTLKQLLRISRAEVPSESGHALSDIEELHDIVTQPRRFQYVENSYPAVVERAKEVLILRKRSRGQNPIIESPLTEAFRSKTPKVIPRYNYSCPNREDIAVVISIFDPRFLSNSHNDYYCITTHSLGDNNTYPPAVVCPSKNVIPQLASLLRSISSVTRGSVHRNTCQFYTWSKSEYASLQSLLTAHTMPSVDDDDIQTCVEALASGASVMRAKHYPRILQGILSNFLKKGTSAEYKALCKRLNLPDHGSQETLRARIESGISLLREEGRNLRGDTNTRHIGQLPPVVTLKAEIERQLALPVPGTWDIQEYMSTLLSEEESCPTEEEMFLAHGNEDMLLLEALLLRRNEAIYSILRDFRTRAVSEIGGTYLVNEAKPLLLRGAVICKEQHIRELFLMQQHEVFSKINALWRSRVDGCPDSPILIYRRTERNAAGCEHVFDVTQYNTRKPFPIKESGDPLFFSHLLVKITDCEDDNDSLPAEAFFDDVIASNTLFHLNNRSTPGWDQQDERIKKVLVMGDVRRVLVKGTQNEQHTTVIIRTWGNDSLLVPGTTFRLSPRLVDFNTPKTLAALFEIDVKWELGRNLQEDMSDPHHRNVPFLQLVVDPASLGQLQYQDSNDLVEAESSVQALFLNLAKTGNKRADQLVLRHSQRRALGSILRNRLSVIWGPPGTGKTHTVSLSLLRLLEVEYRCRGPSSTVVIMTAFTHAAIQVCRGKLLHLMEEYRLLRPTSLEWLEDVEIRFIEGGRNDFSTRHKGVKIYMGTVYQLSKFMKLNSIAVDSIIIDEAGQLPLSSLSLIIQPLKSKGRIIITGDSEQLAPIFVGTYNATRCNPIFGSILDCLIPRLSSTLNRDVCHQIVPSGRVEDPHSHGPLVQLNENFRFNADLCDFISTIYSDPLEPQEKQTETLPRALANIGNIREPSGIKTEILHSVNAFLSTLSMATKDPPKVKPPFPSAPLEAEHTAEGQLSSNISDSMPSLTLIKLYCSSSNMLPVSYDSRLKTEASIASALVHMLSRCSDDAKIFVAVPYRIQKEAVKTMLTEIAKQDETNTLNDAMKSLRIGYNYVPPRILVDTIERLQGAEAEYVICLFSALRPRSSDAEFLLERRRLNVAISRAKTLCILIASDDVLRPAARILANEATASGYAFLRSYEQRALSYSMSITVDNM